MNTLTIVAISLYVLVTGLALFVKLDAAPNRELSTKNAYVDFVVAMLIGWIFFPVIALLRVTRN